MGSRPTKIVLNSDASEKLDYDNPEFPSYMCLSELEEYPGRETISHWHNDIEFLSMIEGHCNYNVNGTDLVIHEGEGVIVNARQFHFEHATDYVHCKYLCIILHPQILCANDYVRINYVEPVLANRNFEYLMLHPNIDWESEILEAYNEMYASRGTEEEPLVITENFMKVWKNLYNHVNGTDSMSPKKKQQLNTLLEMTSYIHHHYSEKIALEDIAERGSVCESTCCSIFKSFTGKTPIIYLNDYRLKKSLDYLITTDMSISDISYEVGFNGASYYTEQFKKKYRCSPTEYRKN